MCIFSGCGEGAAGGPLRPGDVGIVDKDDGSEQPFQVRASDGRTWWYRAPALRVAGSAPVRVLSPSRACGVLPQCCLHAPG